MRYRELGIPKRRTLSNHALPIALAFENPAGRFRRASCAKRRDCFSVLLRRDSLRDDARNTHEQRPPLDGGGEQYRVTRAGLFGAAGTEDR